MRSITWLAPLAAATLLGGCIPSYPLTDEALDTWWSLTADTAAGAPLLQPVVAERRLPARWVIRQDPSLIRSTVSMVAAMDRAKAGAPEVTFSVSPTYAHALEEIIAEMRHAIEELAELAESHDRSDRARWAAKLAGALVQIEQVSRQAGFEKARRPGSPAGATTEPMLAAVVVFLNEQTGGTLLSDLGPEEVDRLRSVLSQLALRLGFSMIGKQLPEKFRATVTDSMRSAERLDTLRTSLQGLLTDAADDAAPASKDGQLDRSMRALLAWAPRALKMLEAFVAQWEKIDAIELELRDLPARAVLAATIRVKPGQTVRIADVMLGQPTMVFRGASRIVALGETAPTGDTVILFEPIGDGGVELHFEGFLYGLVRLFAIPLADARLREVRIFAHRRAEGVQLINAVILMEAVGDRKDPRRLLAVQDRRIKRIVRGEFAVRSIAESATTIFSYLTPTRRYTYQRETASQGQ